MPHLFFSYEFCNHPKAWRANSNAVETHFVFGREARKMDIISFVWDKRAEFCRKSPESNPGSFIKWGLDYPDLICISPFKTALRIKENIQKATSTLPGILLVAQMLVQTCLSPTIKCSSFLNKSPTQMSLNLCSSYCSTVFSILCFSSNGFYSAINQSLVCPYYTRP